MDQSRFQDQLQLVSVIPDRMVYNAREKIALIFNNTLPSTSQGSYFVEFHGRRRESMQVKASKVNSSTLIVEAPVYNPAEKVRIHIRHMTHEGTKSIGSLPFEFISRDTLMAHLLQGCADPVMFMCEALGISPCDMVTLDKALTASFKANMPPGFHLLGLRNNAMENEASNSLYPTLLHFAAAFGLYYFVKDCLIHCSGFFEAIAISNSRDKRPSELAYEGQFMNIYELLYSAETNGEEIYEQMGENNEEDPYYTTACQRVINLNLWQHKEQRPSDSDIGPDGYIETSRRLSEPEDIYTDMGSGCDDGYPNQNSAQYYPPEEIYTDMESGEDQTYPGGYAKQTSGMEPDELYADMECGAEEGDRYVDVQSGEPEDDPECLYMNEQEITAERGKQPASSYYQVPSDLPVCQMYPEARSISVSLNSRNDYKPQTPPPTRLKAKPGPPVVPSRKSQPLAPPSRSPRPPSTISAASDHSSISVDSGISESYSHNLEQDENQFMSREELFKNIHSKPSEDSGAPPPPPTDYHEQPPPRSRGNRNHERSKTLPVSPSDVTTAQSLLSRPGSVKDGRPGMNRRTTSDLSQVSASSRPPAPPPNPDRRGSDTSSRPPPPIPGITRQGIPTPFAMAVQEEEPPPPPRRRTKAPQAPTPQPRQRTPR